MDEGVVVLSINEVAGLLGLAVKTLYNWPETALPPRLKLPQSNRVLFLKADVLAWLNAHVDHYHHPGPGLTVHRIDDSNVGIEHAAIRAAIQRRRS